MLTAASLSACVANERMPGAAPAPSVPLPFAASCNLPDCTASLEHAPNRFYVYGVVARLALLAASIELEQTDPDQSRYG